MNQVRKVQLFFIDSPQQFPLPAGAEPLGFNVIDNNASLFVLADTAEEATVARYFTIIGTDQPVPDGALYIGTSNHVEKPWHLFETEPPVAAVQVAAEEAAPQAEVAAA